MIVKNKPQDDQAMEIEGENVVEVEGDNAGENTGALIEDLEKVLKNGK